VAWFPRKLMLKVPPPIWALAYLLVAAGISYLAGWLVRLRKADATMPPVTSAIFPSLPIGLSLIAFSFAASAIIPPY